MLSDSRALSTKNYRPVTIRGKIQISESNILLFWLSKEQLCAKIDRRLKTLFTVE